MEEDEQPSVNLIPCLKWVRQGVAKAIPDKVILNERELAEIIKKAKDNLNDAERGEESSSDEENATESSNTGNRMVTDDEFNLSNYDNEKDERDAVLGIGDIALYDTQDPPAQLNDDDDDSEKEDDEIKPSDNLILVGHVEGDASILEVYVYNEEEGSLYVHHDFLLPSFPLCIEWLNYDPSDPKPGNLCAVGTMEPIIEVWDLDIMDCLESAYILGKKQKKKKKQKIKQKDSLKNGHKDAVLALAWNEYYHHVLASGSADQTVLLWDLTAGEPNKRLKTFNEKVQALQWHPFESYSLLTGSCDKVTRVFDCREDTSKNCLSWEHEGEIETVAWNTFQPFCFLTGTSEGFLTYIDCRNQKPVWSLQAHEKAITGLYMSSKCPGLVTTASNDGFICTWDLYDENVGETYESLTEPTEIFRQEAAIGDIQCLGANPNSPFVVAIGGDKRSKNFKVIDLRDKQPVSERFSKRKLVEIKVDDTGESQQSGSS